MKKNSKKDLGRVDVNVNSKIAMRVSIVSVIINLFLSAAKLIAGIVASSGAMVSDAVHSASDVFSTFVVMIGVSLSSKKSDDEHPYGHERLECVASNLLAVVLAITGFGIGLGGIKKILAGNYGELEIPGVLALVAAIVSIAVKEWMYWYTRAAAKKTNSGALMADAWHHRSDALSSIGALIGIFGARMGMPIFDPIASVVICVFIEKAAVDIFRDSMRKMVDRSCTDSEIEQMKQIISAQPEVYAIDDIKTRLFGSKIYVDVEIVTDGNKTLNEAHSIAEGVHKAIEDSFVDVKHCMVHVNPMIKTEDNTD